MNVDPRTAPVTAKILFRGVMLVCINENDQYEVGFIPCPEHTPTITIEKQISGNPPVLVNNWEITKDFYVHAVNPVTQGTDLHSAPGQDTDSGFIPDLEGPKLHNGKVNVQTSNLTARFGVTAGKLYSHELTDDNFDLVEFVEFDLPARGTLGKFGRLAAIGGLNILCQNGEGSGVSILDNGTGEQLEWLETLDDTSYLITIDNDCGATTPQPIGTDFRHYYKVIEARDRRRFDFQVTGDVAPPGPEVCNFTRLSRTRTLGLNRRRF